MPVAETAAHPVRIAGAGLAATGLAHFVVPWAFDVITRPLFPDDTLSWIKRNGAAETAIGAALVVERTRPLGTLGLTVYVLFLGGKLFGAVRNRAQGH